MKRAVVPVEMRGDPCIPMAAAMGRELDRQTDAAQGLPAIPWALSRIYGQTIAAAPNAGRVSRADVEAAARAIHGSDTVQPWPTGGCVVCRNSARAALTAIGIELETE